MNLPMDEMNLPMDESARLNILKKYRMTSVDLSVETFETTRMGQAKPSFLTGRYSVTARRGPDLEVSVRRSHSTPEKILGVLADVMDQLEERT